MPGHSPANPLIDMTSAVVRIPSANGEPAWESAYMLPVQGSWSEEDFLKFHTNRMQAREERRVISSPTSLSRGFTAPLRQGGLSFSHQSAMRRSLPGAKVRQAHEESS